MDADELYALPPEEFTAARDAAAKAAKTAAPDRAKDLKALRKPTVSAWLVNLLAAHETDLLEQLLGLGPALAEAQARGHGDELRELGAQRRALVDAVTAQAVALGGRTVTSAVREEVSGTLETALADAAAAEAVRSGRLVRPLSYAGFGGVDLDGAVAVSRPQPPKKPAPDGEAVAAAAAAVAAAEAAALEAAGHLDDAVRGCERWAAEHEAAEQERTAAEQAVQRARQALAEAEEAATSARQREQRAAAAADAAQQRVRQAQEVAESARAELDRLRRS